MTTNYIEEQFKTYNLFVDESVFEPSYIPKKILHRENELILLSKMFLPILKEPTSMSKKILVSGEVGIGKTVTLHAFSEMLKESSTIRGINIRILHFNCRILRTSYQLLGKIVDNLIGNVPSRGLSPTELFNIFSKYLEETSTHLILILDEMDYLLKTDSELIYSLCRMNELYYNHKHYFSLIGVIKNLQNTSSLDEATLSTLQNEVIQFRKYSLNEIIDILEQRVLIGLKKNVISNDLIEMVAKICSETGDIRYALKILKNAVIYSEHNVYDKITAEAIRFANSEFHSIGNEDLLLLNLHELFLLKAICNNLMMKKKQNAQFVEVKEEYFNVCDAYSEKNRSNTQIWEYLQNLKKYDLISTVNKSQKNKNRQIVIQIPNYPINFISKQIDDMILKKRR